MNSDVWTLTTSTFGTVAVIAAYTVVSEWLFRTPARIDQRLKEEFGPDRRGSSRDASIFKGLQQPAEAAQRSIQAKLHAFVEQSGLTLTASRLLEIAGAAALIAGMVASFFVPHWSLAILVATAAFFVPFIYVQVKRRKRIEKLSNQLPEAFELMSRAVRAGQTMAAAFKLVATECKAPLAAEFSQCCQEQDLGLPVEASYRELAKRNGVMEMDMFIVALLVQRQTGGSPVEMLNNLSKTIRARIRMKGRVKALTGEGRLQAAVLSVLPPIAFAAVYLLKPAYAQILLDRPLVLLGVVVSTLIGTLWIKKTVNIDY